MRTQRRAFAKLKLFETTFVSWNAKRLPAIPAKIPDRVNANTL
jgi:hypothetical protein